jgi:endo-1,4-beta-mannosidase
VARSILITVVVALALVGFHAATGAAVELGVEGARFTLDGKPAFLLGMSYYGALGASRETIDKDLDELRRLGFNWIRVWATWAAFGNDVAAVDGQGHPRPEQLERLRQLVAACDQRGLVVDVTLSRGNGVTGRPRLATLEDHRRAVETIVQGLKPLRNWYLDLANERNIKDQRYASFEDLKALRAAVRTLDPKRLVTASHAGDLSRDEVTRYVKFVGVDFLTPHRPRNARSPRQTAERTQQYLAWAKEAGRVVPVHYQEPFRRGFTEGWEPSASDFLADAEAARASGAAGWCLHNGDQRRAPGSRPRRSFDLRDGRLFEQLDAVEQEVARRLDKR